MEGSMDFLQLFNADLSSYILSCLDDPADIVRVSSVSRSWRQFVIANGLCKKLCLRLFPEVSSATSVIEVNNMIEPIEAESTDSVESENLKRDHLVYAVLARGPTPNLRKDCILEAISASSTDNYPEESIQNTLEPSDRVNERPSYWSSEGESDPGVPETLTYKLASKLCFITEINIQPFQAFFQSGFPIYSARAVRFRMGHSKAPEMERDLMDESEAGHRSVDDYIVWTYVSPDFPMLQEKCLQKFNLPQPVLCIGGILQIELLGRVQQQEMDGLYYICVSHVQVVGRPLTPVFDAELIDLTGTFVLKYCPTVNNSNSSTAALEDETGAPSHLHSFTARLMQRAGLNFERMIRHTLLRDVGNVDYNGESDDEYIE
ncbi:F-box domain [Macleaya cordata]|uniref:F-box domain n=1 Tax=Macleaya cordata TaxID=56857 RepID=A0A200QUL4_MACCD|nr:F-box domain [Macleaya cordata]